MRELIEQGFEVAVVKDATAAAKHPDLGDGYATALTNFGFIASDVIATEDAVKAILA
jgi:nicotinamidase-related amidase